MATKLQVVNIALGFLGEPGLLDLTTDCKLLRTANTFYDTARDCALRFHTWNFAIKRVALVVDATAPVFEFAYRYTLPNDYIRLVYTDDDIYTREDGTRWPYKIEGAFLITDLSSVKIKYVAKITDETLFDPYFTLAFGCYLAYLMSMNTTEHRNQTSDLYALFKDKVSEARFIESQEGTPDAAIDGGWLAARA